MKSIDQLLRYVTEKAIQKVLISQGRHLKGEQLVIRCSLPKIAAEHRTGGIIITYCIARWISDLTTEFCHMLYDISVKNRTYLRAKLLSMGKELPQHFIKGDTKSFLLIICWQYQRDVLLGWPRNM